MNARRRVAKRRDWPKNLYQKADGYFWYRNPITKKTKGLGRDRMEAFNAADAANAALASHKALDLVAWVKGVEQRKLKDWLTEYEEIVIKDRALKKNTINQLRSNLRAIAAADFVDLSLEKVTTAMVAAFLKTAETERGATAAAQTRRTLHDVYREAEVRGLIENGKNPVTVTRSAKSEVKRDRLSLEQFLAIREQAPTWLINAMNLALLSGQRREDVAKAKFTDIRDGYLYVEQKKTGAKVRLKLSNRLNAIGMSLDDVVRQCRDRFSQYLVHHTLSKGSTRAGAAVNMASLTSVFAECRDKAGIKPRDGRTPPSFHEIRSLAGRLYADEYGPEFSQRLLGHKSAQMTAKYHDARGSEWTEVAAN